MRESKKRLKNFGLIGIMLCATCCALPIAGVGLGAGSFALLLRYFEWAGIAALVLALVFFGLYSFRKRKEAASCDIDCACKPETDLASRQDNNYEQ
jgi:hypothetical protein